MERKSNITAWQLNLFEGFDKDVMVMQRDEEEVFDDAIHVFFEREYFDTYVSIATKYSTHRYAYHEDKLGEVINQIFEEDITGLVFHISVGENIPKNVLCDEKYLSAKDLLGLKDAVDSYHYLYMSSIDRGSKESAVARLWTKYVYIIGQLPDFRNRPANGEKPVVELMTMKRKKNGEQATAEDFDYESLAIFLTAESAMRFNHDKKPINKYKLAMLSKLFNGKLQMIIEPNRSYRLEYDPATINLRGHLDIPQFNEEMVKARVKEYFELEKVYILLAPHRSDYRASLGNPFLMKLDEKNIMMYVFEDYGRAVSYVLQNPTLLPVFDGIFPIGMLDKNDKLLNLNVMTAIAGKLGATTVTLDADTINAIVCKLEFFRDTSGAEFEVENLLEGETLDAVMREDENGKQYRFPVIPFCDSTNDYAVSEERAKEVISHMDSDADQGLAYLTGCSLSEMMHFLRETVSRFEKARQENDEEKRTFYNRLLNMVTIPLTEALCEKPYIFTLREDNGDFTLKNQLAYLIVTNRFEAGRQGDGRLTPAGIDNQQFMDKLYEASKVVALTDGPNVLCLVDTKLMGEVAKQWKKTEQLREELIIYLMQGCGLSYTEALHYYKRLKTDDGIFVEFATTVRNGEYPPMGVINIDGHTAKSLADENGLSFVEAYNTLLSIKLGEITPEISGGDNGDSGDRKGIFGKLFKK